MGDPFLYKVADPVRHFNTPELEQLVEDMFETMMALDGAGLAAPQIAESTRVVIFEVEHNPRYPDADPVPRTVLVNPEIEYLTDATALGWEGCLSVPRMRGLVARCIRIQYCGFSPSGQPISRVADGFHARVVQHECDHLDGILYPMRVRDLRNFGFESAMSDVSSSVQDPGTSSSAHVRTETL